MKILFISDTSLDQIMNFVELEIDIYSRSPDTHKLFELAERLKETKKQGYYLTKGNEGGNIIYG